MVSRATVFAALEVRGGRRAPCAGGYFSIDCGRHAIIPSRSVVRRAREDDEAAGLGRASHVTIQETTRTAIAPEPAAPRAAWRPGVRWRFWPPTLRVTLLSLLLVLLIGTVGVVAGASYLTTRISLLELEDRYV